MRIQILLLLLLTGCATSTEVAEFPKLDEASDRRESVQIAIDQTSTHLIGLGENPHHYYLIGIREADGVLLLDLSHQFDFEKKYNNTLGNRSGKSMSCEYDMNLNKVAKCLLWK